MIDMKKISFNCKMFRLENGFYQYDVANETGYSTENVSSFENGRNDNSRILLWYIRKGISISDLFRGV